MYDPADILTHPDFTEVNHTWDKISQEHQEKLRHIAIGRNAIGLTLVVIGAAMIIYGKKK